MDLFNLVLGLGGCGMAVKRLQADTKKATQFLDGFFDI